MSAPNPSASNRDERAWHALHADEALAALDADAVRGLTTAEAQKRRERFGPNALPETAGRAWFSVVLGQFKSPLIYILMVAAGIALALEYVSDATVILVVVLLNALIGTYQEGRAERSLKALRNLSAHTARVVRDGAQGVIDARELVPGDILLLDVGIAIVADARLLEGAALQTAEGALTGESVPVAKHSSTLISDTLLADRKNMIYTGTHVTTGRARAVVVATGLATEIGRIAALAGAAQEPPTPLERRIAQFGRYVIVAAAAMFVVVVGIGSLRGMRFGEIFMIAISQLVGMVPEGLPVAMTIALSIGVQRMAGRRAVVRRLSAVETLGSTTVICSDKTGTLTRNEMTATALYLPDGRAVTVTGAGYAPDGSFVHDGRPLDPAHEPELRALLEAGALCNDAQLQVQLEPEPHLQPIGDPTEVALLTLAMKGGINLDQLRMRAPRRAELPFDAEVQMMATQHEAPAGAYVVLKGAPEVVLRMCRALRVNGQDVVLAEPTRAALHAEVESMAQRALRVLAVAVVDGAELNTQGGFEALRDRAVLLGLIGQIDPPRPGVQQAVSRCRDAGIRTVMVTGDHKATGQAIATDLGIFCEGDAAIDGRELALLSDLELAERIDGIAVFARVHPAQKLRIVEAYQARGEVVAMTGDGVNDAPALVKADVGVAMGITGTDVAKEAANIIIADDNFESIVAAVEEGRVVYRNIKKAVLLLMSTSAAEVLVLLIAMLLGYPAPFAAVQILWNNLVTEGLITVNLIMEPAEGDEMRRSPISRDEPLLTRLLLTRMAFMVPAIVIPPLGWLMVRIAVGVPEAQVRTEIFTLLAICEWFNVLNCRSESKSALTLGLLRNPWLLGGIATGVALQLLVVSWPPLGNTFHTVPLGPLQWVALAAAGSLVLWVEELRKLYVRGRA